MSDLQAQWKKLGARFDAYSQRERTLLAAAIVGGVLLVGFSLLVDPNFARARVVNRLAMQQGSDVQSAEAQLQVLQSQLKVDPDAGRKAEIDRLKSKLVDVENALKKLEGGLVAPERMNVVLERLLAGNAGLRLVSLKSLPPVNLADTGKPADGDIKAAAAGLLLGLYKHGVEVRVEGSYADLYTWLSQLEGTREKILWGDARLLVVEHPRSQLSVTIYTLSTDKAWLAI